MTTDLIQLHTGFWEFRHMMELYWTTPETLDAARFAKTEAGEVLKTCGLWEAFVAFAASRQAQIAAADALDAVLRKNASYSRNTARDMDERNELGDLAMMLLTVMGPAPVQPDELDDATPPAPPVTVDDIVIRTGYVYKATVYTNPVRTVRVLALETLLYIDRYPGMDLPQMLQSRMNRIYRKHHPDAKAAPAPSPDEAGGALQDTPLVWRSETPATYTLTSAEGLL